MEHPAYSSLLPKASLHHMSQTHLGTVHGLHKYHFAQYDYDSKSTTEDLLSPFTWKGQDRITFASFPTVAFSTRAHLQSTRISDT